MRSAGQGSQQTLHRADHQVVGVFDRPPSQDRLGVHREPERPARQQPGCPGLLHAAEEDQPHLLVEDQVRPEELQGALGAQGLPKEGSQHRAPPSVEGAARDRLPIRDPGFLLQDQQQGQLRGRSAGPTEALMVERRKLRIGEKAAGDPGELAVEGPRIQGHVLEEADVVEVALELALADHRELLTAADAPPSGDSSRRRQTPQRFL